ncbi:MAG: hypothetical protein AAGA90_00665 [Actinomycetota bacterium]
MTTPIHHRRHRRLRHRGTVALTMVVMLAAASCGDVDRADQVVGEGIDGTTSTADSTSGDDEADGDAGADEADGDAAAGDDGDVPTTTESIAPGFSGLAPALPIAEVFEMANPIFAMTGSDSHAVLTAGTRLVVIGEGQTTTIPLTAEVLQFDAFYITTTDTHAIAHGFEYGWGALGGGLNTAVSVDLDTFEVTTRSNPPGTVLSAAARTGAGSTILANDGGTAGTLDATTLEVGAPFYEAPGLTGNDRDTYRIDDEVWTLAGDGTIEVFDVGSGELLRSSSIGRDVGTFIARFMGHDDTTIWLSSPLDGAVGVLDRTTADLIAWIEIGGSFPGAEIEIIQGAGDLLLIDVSDASGDWYVLGELDRATGELTTRHVVAPSTDDQWPTVLDRASFAWVGDELYVQDHMRRVVRVDLDRWGDETLGDWIDPDLSISPAFDGESADLAALAVGWIRGDEGIDRTDPDASAAVLDAVQDWNPGVVAAYAVDIEGDRAFVTLTSSILGVIPLLTFERIDDGWAINSVSECWLVNLAFPQECPAVD